MKNDTFAMRLKEIRLKKGISQTNLAHSIGVSASTVGMYEQGWHSSQMELISSISFY